MSIRTVFNSTLPTTSRPRTWAWDLHFDFGRIDDALKITEYPGEPIQQKITDEQGTTYDVFDVHTFSETWIKTNLMVSSGFAYSHLDNTFSGSRIYGSDFDVGYAPNAQNGFGYFDLSGNSRLNEYVMDLNLLYKPTPNFTIIPSGADSKGRFGFGRQRDGNPWGRPALCRLIPPATPGTSMSAAGLIWPTRGSPTGCCTPALT